MVALVVVLALRRHDLPTGFPHVRAGSFFWPALGCLVGLSLAVGLMVTGRGRPAHARGSGARGRPAPHLRVERWGAGVLITVAVLFLVLTGFPLWTAGQPYFPFTSGEARLAAIVGGNTVGFFSCPSVTSHPDLGILVDANTAYRIHEVPFYNVSSAPTSYDRSLAQATGQPVPPQPNGNWCPSISDAGLARRYGVRWVLAPVGTAAPPGMVARTTIDDEEVLEVPSAASATLVPDDGRRRAGFRHRITGGGPSPRRRHVVDDGRRPRTVPAGPPPDRRARMARDGRRSGRSDRTVGRGHAIGGAARRPPCGGGDLLARGPHPGAGRGRHDRRRVGTAGLVARRRRGSGTTALVVHGEAPEPPTGGQA